MEHTKPDEIKSTCAICPVKKEQDTLSAVLSVTLALTVPRSLHFCSDMYTQRLLSSEIIGLSRNQRPVLLLGTSQAVTESPKIALQLSPPNRRSLSPRLLPFPPLVMLLFLLPHLLLVPLISRFPNRLALAILDGQSTLIPLSPYPLFHMGRLEHFPRIEFTRFKRCYPLGFEGGCVGRLFGCLVGCDCCLFFTLAFDRSGIPQFEECTPVWISSGYAMLSCGLASPAL
jgi:hypothetical protein